MKSNNSFEVIDIEAKNELSVVDFILLFLTICLFAFSLFVWRYDIYLDYKKQPLSYAFYISDVLDISDVSAVDDVSDTADVSDIYDNTNGNIYYGSGL